VNVECKLRCVNFRRVSEPRRAFLPAFRLLGISDDWYRSSMGVIVRRLGTPRNAGENFGCTWEHRQQVRERRGESWEHLGTPWITVEQSGKNNVFFGNAAGAPGNHSYYLLFNDFWNSCIQFVFSAMYQYSYPSTHGISGLRLQAVLESNSRCAW